MQIRVCPVCDQKMASAHYCKTCHRFVRHPYIRNINYYMNEMPPRSESSYAESGQADKHITHSTWKTPNRGQWRPVQLKNAGGHSSKAPFVGFVVLLIAAVAAMLGLGLYFRYEEVPEHVWSTIAEETTEFDPDDYNLDEFGLEDWVEDYEELTDEEVILAGVACNTCGHFQTTGREMEDMLVKFIDEGEYRVDSRDEFSFNDRYENGDTWFSSVVAYYLTSEKKDSYPVLSIDSDTATGQLHEVDIVLEDPAETVEMTGKVLSYLAEQGDFIYDEKDIETVLTGLLDAFEWDEEFSCQIEDVYIDGYVFEREYIVYISCELLEKL